MPQAKFTKGAIFPHIFVMSATNAIGLTALFLVDLADLYFISLLGESELAAAVGYAGTVAFFTTSVGIGLSIAMSALVSKAIGERDREQAKRLAINVLVTGFMISSAISAVVWWLAPDLLEWLGAENRTLELATHYLRIMLPSLPVLGIAMSAGAALRSVGDARRAMWSTLLGGGVNALLDPLFIFVFDWGLTGAALASVVARFTVAGVALGAVVYRHQLLTTFRFNLWLEDLKRIFNVAGPAMMTNVATPIGNAYVTAAIAQYGDSYVAGWAVVGRMIPVAFGMVFSLSGAVGPIIGQNYGAHLYSRVQQTLRYSLGFASAYVLLISLVMWLAQPWLIGAFGLDGDAASLVAFFCTWISFSFLFNGALFIANAAFNNLGYPAMSTMLNFSKATIGTIPFVFIGAQWMGAEGVLAGQALGAVVFGVLGSVLAFRRVQQIQRSHEQESLEQVQADSAIASKAEGEDETVLEPAIPLTPFCSSRSYMCADHDDSDRPDKLEELAADNRRA